jgi:trimeric autotransporter adhesin
LIIDNQKEIRFRETTANGTNYVALKAPASLASDVTFTLPSADGTANQVLKTDGSGVLSFATASTGLEWQSQ